MYSSKIVLTGGGTAGHVNPNIALIPGLKAKGFEVFYVGSKNGIEKRLATEAGLPYYSISTGKLRRYLDVKNITDAARVVKGLGDARKVLKEISPDVIFSKGGFVSVPVVLAAKSLGIPVIIHESDSTPGLANKISFPFCKKICASFPETMKLIPENKGVLTGPPIREELKAGDRDKGLSFCGLTGDKPLIMVMGGSIGSIAINDAVREALPNLLKDFNLVHLCGKNNLDNSLNNLPGYAQFEYIGEELHDVFAATDIMVSRAGANAIFEILALRMPNILIPLPANASRGDQILNAESFMRSGYSKVLHQKDLTKETLISEINDLYENKDTYIENMKSSSQSNAVSIILGLIEEVVKEKSPV